MSKVEMQSPWVVFARACEVLFECDPDVTVELDNDGPTLTIRVNGDDKAESLSQVLPDVAHFGYVEMPIEVVPSNEDTLTTADHVRRAFAGNPALVGVEECPIVPGGPSLTYALFAPEVVQFACDNAGSPYGVRTATYEEIAKEVLDVDGILVTSELL